MKDANWFHFMKTNIWTDEQTFAIMYRVAFYTFLMLCSGKRHAMLRQSLAQLRTENWL